MNVGSFIDCLIDIDRDTEFSGDDADRFSKLVDLGREYENMIMEVPTIDSAALSVYLQETQAEDAVPGMVSRHSREGIREVRDQLKDHASFSLATLLGRGFMGGVPSGKVFPQGRKDPLHQPVPFRPHVAKRRGYEYADGLPSGCHYSPAIGP